LRARGFEVNFRTGITDSSEVRFPAIAGVKNTASGAGHFVAVLEVKEDSLRVADPLTGLREARLSEPSHQPSFTGFYLEGSRMR